MISRPNLLEVEDMVKGFPDQMLFQQAQNPTGEIPQFLLVSEIQRRSNMRKDYEAQQQQPENTVAEQIMQQGIAASVPNQPQMPSMSQQNMAPMPPQMPPQAMPPQQQPMMPMPPQMPPQQSQMPNMGMAQGGVVKMQNLGQVPSMMTGRQFAYHDMGLPISGLSEMTPDEIRGLIDNLIVSGQQEKAMGLINDLRMYAFNPAMVGDPGEMDAYKDIVTQYDVGDYASTTDVDPMRMSVQDALQQYGDAPSAVEGLIDEGGIANLDVAGNIPLSVQSEPRMHPGYTIDENGKFVYENAPEGYIYPESETVGWGTPISKLQSLGARGSSIGQQSIPVTESDVLREKLAIARAVEDAKGIGSLFLPEGGIKVDPKFEDMLSGEMSKRDYARYAGSEMAKPFLALGSKISDYGNKFLSEKEIDSPAMYDRSYQTGLIANDPRFQKRVDLYNRLKEEYGSDVAAAQAIRSAGGQAIDMAGDVGETLAEGASRVKEVSTPFFRQLFTGTQEVAPEVETDTGGGIGTLINNFSQTGYGSNKALTKVTPDIDTSRLKEAQDKLSIYKAAQDNRKNNTKPVVEKKVPASSKSITGNSKIQAQARNDKLDQIESNIAQRNAIDELRGLVGAENYGKVPDMTSLIDEYKDDALSNVLINLGAGIAGGDLSGGLTRAGASALESRRAARDLRKQQLVAEQALQQEGKSRDIDILSSIAKIEAEKDISSAVTKRNNIDALKVMYQEQMRLRAATFDEDEKKRIDDIITRIQNAMAGYGLKIPDPTTKKFGELKTGI